LLLQANWNQQTQTCQPCDMPPKGYKTVICKFWENNMCAKGAGCTFAHGTQFILALLVQKESQKYEY
jgi:hypothetical protein